MKFKSLKVFLFFKGLIVYIHFNETETRTSFNQLVPANTHMYTYARAFPHTNITYIFHAYYKINKMTTLLKINASEF